MLLEIHRRTQGIPRLINGVCDNMLLTAFAMEKRQATLAMLEEVSRDMFLDWPECEPAHFRRRQSRHDQDLAISFPRRPFRPGQHEKSGQHCENNQCHQ